MTKETGDEIEKIKGYIELAVDADLNSLWKKGASTSSVPPRDRITIGAAVLAGNTELFDPADIEEPSKN